MPNQPANPRPGKRFSGASSDPAAEARLEALLQRLYGFYHVEIELSLDRTYRFLKRLGDPHLKLPKTVHIAGTNGKGSTTATLRALLEASGHSVHVYTSPHLVHPTERIRLAGNLISTEGLTDILNECLELNGDEPITFFEIFTCAAFLAFSRVPADFLLLETGMGGRLDTTNVVPDPAACIITTISYDHVKFLGNTLSAIAREKAGIIKPGVPCVIGYQLPEALDAHILDVFQEVSQSLSTPAPLLCYGAEWATAPQADRMLFRYEHDSIVTRKPSLLGNHQLWNAGAALAAFRLIAPAHFTPEILSTALGNIEWPGRLQTLENHPFNRILPEGWKLVIDGGHNDSAGLVLSEQLDTWEKADGKPVHLILAMVNRKDPAAFLQPLLGRVKSLTVTRIKNEPSSFQPNELYEISQKLGFEEVGQADTVRAAIELVAALSKDEAPGRVLMTGSLFFMGNILEEA